MRPIKPDQARRGSSTGHALVIATVLTSVAAVAQLGDGFARTIVERSQAQGSSALDSPRLTSAQHAGLTSLSRIGAELKRVAEPATRRSAEFARAALDRVRAPADFEALQRRLPKILSSDHDVLVVPSLSVEGVESITGLKHYEERLLVELAHLRNPKARVHLVTTEPLEEATLALMAKQLSLEDDALSRLHTYSPPGPGRTNWLSTTALEYPEFVADLRKNLRRRRTYMSIFASSPSEKELAIKLGIPLRGPDPDLQLFWGGKSGSRVAYRLADIDMPAGAEHLFSRKQIVRAIADVWDTNPSLSGIVLKLNQGSSGQGNAILKFDSFAHELPDAVMLSDRRKLIAAHLQELEPANPNWDGAAFIKHMEAKGGALEAFVDGARISPSVQVEIMPDGAVFVHSTHDQKLSGPGGLVYEGCIFPANCEFRLELQDAGRRVGEVLRDQGLIGRFAIDFMSTYEKGAWKHYAVDLNIRKGGTTAPYQWAKALTGAEFDEASGTLRAADGTERYYVATDNHKRVAKADDPHSISYVGLGASDLMPLVDELTETLDDGFKIGAVFQLVGTLKDDGKVGFTAIGRTPDEAERFYNRAIEALDQLARKRKAANAAE